MHKTTLKPNLLSILMLTALFCLPSTQAIAQTPDPDPPETEITGTPPFITELVDRTDLTPEQVEQMRGGGAGWGNIMIAARLAERIAANSEGELTFAEALTSVLDARAQGKGFGQIAHENDLKVGKVDKADTVAAVAEGDDSSNANSRPRYIAELVEKTELTQEQVDQMRGTGAGWGNIMIATRLAERLVADSVDPLLFEDALHGVLEARAAGKGFGEIANENDLKLGRVIRKVNASKAGRAGSPQARVAGGAAKPKKQNIFGRFFRMLGFGKRERAERPPKPEKIERSERPNRPEKPERPNRPEKPEKPERPAKLEKPEKPERGPRR